MARALSRFTIEPDSDGYLLSIEDEEGGTIELVATAEQLDLVAEAIDEHLAAGGDDLEDYDEDADEDE